MEKYQFTPDQLSLMESMKIPFAVYQMIDKRIVTLALSDGFCELFGYKDRAQAYHDMDYEMYREVHPDDAVRLANTAFRFVKEDDRLDVIYRGKAKGSADYHIIHVFGRHMSPEAGVRLGYLWYADEGPYTEETKTDRAELNPFLSNALHEESILKASHYDVLTGLPSMTYFFELAKAGRDLIHSEGGKAVMLYMDLNGMKFYNHSHGLSDGDKLLKAFALLLISTFGKENCCRVGADHFAAYTREEGLENTLRQFFLDCQKINGGNSLPVKVGVYSTRLGAVPVSTACDRAKLACDTLQGGYESEFSYYSPALRDDAVNKRYIIENIDRAIEEKWIQVYYQPIVRAVNGRVCDEEALARWIDPVKGFLSPAQFVPYLEDAGLIYKLDLCVLDQTLEKIKRQQEAGLQIVPQSINLSRSDFDMCDIVEEIRRRVDAAGVKRDNITVEITESVIGSDFDFMKAQVERFQSLGFPVWMDDFGSGYSSLDELQSIKFTLLKFDMRFMQKLNQGESSKIILTELMKMATSLGMDTVCEGVETEEQVRFLREIGCSKLQGYYFCKPIPYEQIVERYQKGIQIGFENAEESEYYEAVSRVNLYDLAVIANEDENAFQNFFNTLPMGIMEIKDDQIRFMRTNQSYRDFIKRFFGVNLSDRSSDFQAASLSVGSSFLKLVKQCCVQGGRAFFDEQMPDGSIVHSFARRIAFNPVTGSAAAAIAVLSISHPDEGATYASIARALAADYYNIYYVDLETDRFIEYSSTVGGDELAIERHGEHFFESSLNDSATRICEEDRAVFLASFNKENIIRELDQQGVFTITYRLIDTGRPIYVNMKITRMQPGGNHIIIGISNIDSQMRQKEEMERIQKERDTLARVMALSEDYLTLYMVNPETERYVEYNATDEYKSLGLAVEGEDFFRQCIINSEKVICPDDREQFRQRFTKENILKGIQEDGVFKMNYKLMIQGEERPITLKIAPIKDDTGEKLVMGVRAWKIRK
ncbi:MAG: EAL domain-containing protein [Clostridia bacterium]|nr:EAL domain-containing protein [Clostridia bacterium]